MMHGHGYFQSEGKIGRTGDFVPAVKTEQGNNRREQGQDHIGISGIVHKGIGRYEIVKEQVLRCR